MALYSALFRKYLRIWRKVENVNDLMGTECLNTKFRFPLLTLLCIGYSVKLKKQTYYITNIIRLNTPIPTFRRVLQALRVEWRNSTPRFAIASKLTNNNLNINPMWDRIHDYRVYSRSLTHKKFNL